VAALCGAPQQITASPLRVQSPENTQRNDGREYAGFQYRDDAGFVAAFGRTRFADEERACGGFFRWLPQGFGGGIALPVTAMNPSEYQVVGVFTNDTKGDMRIFLEMTCEEVFLAPGNSIELLARPTADLRPITVSYLEDGLQIFAHREWDPDWHIRFKNKILKPAYPTRLSEHE